MSTTTSNGRFHLQLPVNNATARYLQLSIEGTVAGGGGEDFHMRDEKTEEWRVKFALD